MQAVWKRWTNDYLCNLQNRTKKYFEKSNVNIGDLTIIEEGNMVACNWPLGRIMNLFPRKYNEMRVVFIKTQKSIFKRHVTKICLLPMES